jgi:hypothetical protein
MIASCMGSNHVRGKSLLPWAWNCTLIAQYWWFQEFIRRCIYKLIASYTIELKCIQYRPTLKEHYWGPKAEKHKILFSNIWSAGALNIKQYAEVNEKNVLKQIHLNLFFCVIHSTIKVQSIATVIFQIRKVILHNGVCELSEILHTSCLSRPTLNGILILKRYFNRKHKAQKITYKLQTMFNWVIVDPIMSKTSIGSFKWHR